MRSHASWSNRCRGASCSCAARSARTILLAANVVVIGVARPRLYLSLARPSRKLAGVRPTARAHPRRRGDQPGAVGGRGRGGPAPVGGVLLRKLRLGLRRQGRDVRAGGGGAARPAASHRGAFPARAARHRRDVSALHPFSLLAIAAALPAFAWILPAPTGGLATAGLALMLPLVPDPRWGVRVVRLALLTAAPFWLFLRLLHDGPTTVAIGGRITTMVASFVWLVAVLSPDRLVEAMVARGWSLAVAYVFAATLSAVPVLKARARRIVEAQRCRGLSPRGSVANRLPALRALALPLVLSALPEGAGRRAGGRGTGGGGGGVGAADAVAAAGGHGFRGGGGGGVGAGDPGLAGARDSPPRRPRARAARDHAARIA